MKNLIYILVLIPSLSFGKTITCGLFEGSEHNGRYQDLIENSAATTEISEEDSLHFEIEGTNLYYEVQLQHGRISKVKIADSEDKDEILFEIISSVESTEEIAGLLSFSDPRDLSAFGVRFSNIAGSYQTFMRGLQFRNAIDEFYNDNVWMQVSSSYEEMPENIYYLNVYHSEGHSIEVKGDLSTNPSTSFSLELSWLSAELAGHVDFISLQCSFPLI